MGGGGGKGGGKGGGGGGQSSYNYFASFAGVLRVGPGKTLYSFLVDQKEAWSGSITPGSGGNPYTLSITDAQWLAGGGYVKSYWGGLGAPDALIATHPAYKDFWMLACKLLLCGRERTSLPNVQAIAEAEALPPASVIPTTTIVNNCVNPIAIAAEVIASADGLACGAGILDPASWQAVHDWCAASAARVRLTYCAPLLSNQMEARQFLNDLLSLADAVAREKGDGTIELKHYDPNPGDLSNYRTLTANDLTAPPDLTAETWADVPTGIIVVFTDADRNFKQTTSPPVDNYAHPRVTSRPNRITIDLSIYVTNATQANQLAAEMMKRKCRPKLTGTISVRREKATNLDGSPLRPGDRFLLDIDPEPGGDGLAQLCRVMQRRFGATGPVKLTIESEANQPAVPFTPTYTPPDLEASTVENIVNARIIPLPPAFAEGKAAIGVLASRADDLTIGAKVLFDVDGGSGVFAQIGNQTGFAVRCQFAADYSQGASGLLRLTILDTRDQHIALKDLGDSAAQDDELLLIAVDDDGAGYLEEDANGFAKFEIMSIKTYAAVSGNTYDFTVLRSRLGTKSFPWVTAQKIWIISKASLLAHTHKNFPDYLRSHGNLKFRLLPYNRSIEFDGSPSEFNFKFPPGFAPPVITWITPAADARITADFFVPEALITDPNNDIVEVELFRYRVDTGAYVLFFKQSLNRVGSIKLSDLYGIASVPPAITTSVPFGSGTTHPFEFLSQTGIDTVRYLTVRAKDSTGNITESVLRLVRAPSSGSPNIQTPSSSPPGGYYSPGNLVHTVSAPAPATFINGVITASTSLTPPAGNAWTKFTNPVNFTDNATGFKRCWHRAGRTVSGVDEYGAWVFFDFHN